MGAKDSKTVSSADKIGTKEALLQDDQPQTRTRKHLTKNFENKFNVDAEEFPLRKSRPDEEGTINYGVYPVLDGKYSDQKDEPWVKFLLKKEQERVRKSPAKPLVEVPKPQIKLQTNEYLKLLKSGDATQTRKKGKLVDTKSALPITVPKIFKPLSTDLALAMDEIIQFRCKGMQNGKSVGHVPSKDEALLNIVKMFESKGATIGNKMDTTTPATEEVIVATCQDDLEIEKLNRDEDLAEPTYWSDDERAPRQLQLASAHKLGRHPLHSSASLPKYVMQDLDSQLDHEVAKLLLNSQRLGNRHKTFEQSPPTRYMVTGLKEVCRAVKYGKAKCVVVAPDIEDSTAKGGVDSRLHEILRGAYQADIPVVFALSRARMGHAMRKTLKISVLCLVETKGIENQFDNVLSLAYEKRQSWIQRMPPARS